MMCSNHQRHQYDNILGCFDTKKARLVVENFPSTICSLQEVFVHSLNEMAMFNSWATSQFSNLALLESSLVAFRQNIRISVLCSDMFTDHACRRSCCLDICQAPLIQPLQRASLLRLIAYRNCAGQSLIYLCIWIMWFIQQNNFHTKITDLFFLKDQFKKPRPFLLKKRLHHCVFTTDGHVTSFKITSFATFSHCESSFAISFIFCFFYLVYLTCKSISASPTSSVSFDLSHELHEIFYSIPV